MLEGSIPLLHGPERHVMDERSPFLSLIVPTRQRLPELQRMLQSVARTISRPARIEIVLVVDEDDPPSVAYSFDRLRLTRVVLPPRQTMGMLNRAGCAAAMGRYVMLLNDDVVARTRGWDRAVETALARYPDDLVLVHVDDGLFREVLCTFPIVSKEYCKLAGGICPPEYERYRIDDHIEDAFNLLWYLGQPRTIYLPDVLFEHFRFHEGEAGERQYHYDEPILARDARRFLERFQERKNLALRMMNLISGSTIQQGWSTALERIDDPFSLRVPERLQVVTEPLTLGRRLQKGIDRARACVDRSGYAGLAGAIWKRAVGRSSCKEPHRSGP